MKQPTKLTRLHAFFVVLSLALGAIVGMASPASAFPGNNYPEPWRSSAINAYVDDWGYYSRNCTSWVAWALHDRNDFEMPRAIGNAANWGHWASSNGYSVNMTPAVGSVAWWDDGNFGHVAWVESINGDQVTIEEYNYNWSGNHNVRTISRTSVSGYIHFKDITSTPPTPPAEPPHHDRDFNGNGKADILWYGPGSDVDAIWYGASDRNSPFNTTLNTDVTGAYTPFTGDFDGDGRGDIFWYGPGDAHDALWYGTGTGGEFTWYPVNVRDVYTPIVGDFNGNGKDDILWYGPGSENDAIWYGNADRTMGFNKTLNTDVTGTYTPISGDFDGDGKWDILWYGPGDAVDALWYGTTTGGHFSGASVSIRGVYTPIVGDFNGNKKWDILWYGPGADTDAIWYGNADRTMGFNKTVDINVSGTYTPIAGDFDGDRKCDILWYGPGDAHDALWYGNYTGGEFSWYPVTVRGVYTPVVSG